MRIVKLNLNESASLVIYGCQARVPTKYRSNCIIKCKRLYEKLWTLEKHKTWSSEFVRKSEN